MRSIANQAVRKDRKGVLHVRANVQRMREICKGCTNVLAQKQLANHHTAQTLLIAKMAHSVMELYFRLRPTVVHSHSHTALVIFEANIRALFVGNRREILACA